MKNCPKCGGDKIIGVQYSYDCKHHFDGVSEWVCGYCNYREGRFCGQELKDSECESVECDGRHGHPVEVSL